MIRLNKKSGNTTHHISESGFTFIELLIVIVVIGIIATIAIPQYSSYRQRAYDTSAMSDIKRLQTDLAAYYASKQEYPTTPAGGVTLTEGNIAGIPGMSISPSSGVTLWFESNGNAYISNAWHRGGSNQYGANQKYQHIFFAPGIIPLHGTLADNIAIDQIWPAPWSPL